MPEKQPRVAVFCRCGAAWFGKHTEDNPDIPPHGTRTICGFMTAGDYRTWVGRIKWPTHWTAAERRAAAGFAHKVSRFGMPRGW